MSGEAKKVKEGTGIFEVTFVNDFGSYKKGEKAKYHASTAKSLEKKKIVTIGKEDEEYISKTIKK